MKFIIKKENPFDTFKTKEEAQEEIKKMRSHMACVLTRLNGHINACNKLIKEIDESGIPEFDWLLTYKEINYVDFVSYHIYRKRHELENHIHLCEQFKKMINENLNSYGPEFIEFFQRVKIIMIIYQSIYTIFIH